MSKDSAQGLWHLKAWGLAILFFALCVFVQSTQADSTTTKQTLTLAMPEEQMAAISGHEDVIREAFTRAGLGLKIVTIPGNRATFESRAGIVDGEVARTEFLEVHYPELIPIKVNLRTAHYWVLVHRDNSCPATISDLYRLTSVSLLGAVVHNKIRELISGPNVTVRSPEAMLQVLHAKRGDYTIAPLRAAKTHGQEQEIFVKPCFDKPFLTTKLYTYLNKKHAHLIPELEAAYTQVIEKNVKTSATTP